MIRDLSGPDTSRLSGAAIATVALNASEQQPSEGPVRSP